MNATYNYPMVPEEATRHTGKKQPPVTRRELGGDFHMGVQFINHDWRESGIFEKIIYELKLADMIVGFQWFWYIEDRKACLDASRKDTSVPGWEDTARKHAAKGMRIPAANSMAMEQISRPHYEKMREIFGVNWFGFTEGEWDGAYIERVARGGIDVSPTRSRQEACLHYLDWLKETYRRHHNYMITVSSVGFCHYSAECGTRMVGLELSQALPSNTVLISACRGAGKQYDLLMLVFPSVFSRRGYWGLKSYPKDGPQSRLLKEGHLVGPDHGATVELLKRLWWLCYMNGFSIIGLEAAYFPCDASGEYSSQGAVVDLKEPCPLPKIMAQFTPVGWLHWEARQAVKRHPLRGVPYIPFAVMLPFDHGWYPQPNIYSYDRDKGVGSLNCIWGNIPFAQGDWQIDRFFNWVYPGYKLANWVDTRDERGIISNTPFGDSFDIILSNADDECLTKYQAVILLGDFDGFASENLPERLKKFIRAGGTVIADIAHISLLPPEVRYPEKDARAKTTVYPISFGAGRILYVLHPAWGADLSDTKVFSCVTKTLEPFLREYELVQIDGRPIHYLVNVTDRPDELLITLCNNSAEMSWEGHVAVAGQEIVEVEEWLAYGEASVENGRLRCGVPANNIRVYRVKTSRPFLSLRFRDIPWEKLGYGATPRNVS